MHALATGYLLFAGCDDGQWNRTHVVWASPSSVCVCLAFLDVQQKPRIGKAVVPHMNPCIYIWCCRVRVLGAAMGTASREGSLGAARPVEEERGYAYMYKCVGKSTLLCERLGREQENKAQQTYPREYTHVLDAHKTRRKEKRKDQRETEWV